MHPAPLPRRRRHVPASDRLHRRRVHRLRPGKHGKGVPPCRRRLGARRVDHGGTLRRPQREGVDRLPHGGHGGTGLLPHGRPDGDRDPAPPCLEAGLPLLSGRAALRAGHTREGGAPVQRRGGCASVHAGVRRRCGARHRRQRLAGGPAGPCRGWQRVLLRLRELPRHAPPRQRRPVGEGAGQHRLRGGPVHLPGGGVHDAGQRRHRRGRDLPLLSRRRQHVELRPQKEQIVHHLSVRYRRRPRQAVMEGGAGHRLYGQPPCHPAQGQRPARDRLDLPRGDVLMLAHGYRPQRDGLLRRLAREHEDRGRGALPRRRRRGGSRRVR